MSDPRPLPMETWRVVRRDGCIGHWGLTPWSDETWTIECLAPVRNYLGVMQERRFHNPRVAICALMAERSESIVEIVAPGEMTAAEQVAAMKKRCVDVCRGMAERMGAAPTRWTGTSRAFIGGARNCATAIDAMDAPEEEDDE